MWSGCPQQGRYNKIYQHVCTAVGVELTSRDDKDKSFGPCTEGIVLGIVFNSDDWVWYLREDKLSVILEMLKEALQADQLTLKSFQSFTLVRL